MQLPTEVHVSNIPPTVIFFLSFTSSKCHNIAFTCQSREIRERGLTDMLDKRSIASTERLNRLASPPSGTADAPGINQAAASPQPGVGRLANNAVGMPKGKCECGRGGEAHRKQEVVLVRLGIALCSANSQLPLRCSGRGHLTVNPLPFSSRCFYSSTSWLSQPLKAKSAAVRQRRPATISKKKNIFALILWSVMAASLRHLSLCTFF